MADLVIPSELRALMYLVRVTHFSASRLCGIYGIGRSLPLTETRKSRVSQDSLRFVGVSLQSRNLSSFKADLFLVVAQQGMRE